MDGLLKNSFLNLPIKRRYVNAHSPSGADMHPIWRRYVSPIWRRYVPPFWCRYAFSRSGAFSSADMRLGPCAWRICAAYIINYKKKWRALATRGTDTQPSKARLHICARSKKVEDLNCNNQRI